MQLDVAVRKSIGEFQLEADFSLAGERVGVFGPSGSGKSTLLALLAGLRSADSGVIQLDGEVLFDSDRKINLPPEQRRIGVVFQHAHLFPHMSVYRNVLYGWKRLPPAERRIDPQTLFQVLGLEPLLQRHVATLSGGERQRVALARTVLACPRMLLLDEPLTGLDATRKAQIMGYLKRIFAQFEIPLLFISHSMREMQIMTEEVLVLEQGRIKLHQTSEELARSLWSSGRSGYTNLLQLGQVRPVNDLYGYRWGARELILTEPGEGEEHLFELDAREILLFKRHPEATSARNLLTCRVEHVAVSGNRVRVELVCGGQQLVAQIVPESVRELGVAVGCELVAAIKASAFRRIW